jgi:hypothetical protein
MDTLAQMMRLNCVFFKGAADDLSNGRCVAMGCNQHGKEDVASTCAGLFFLALQGDRAPCVY